VGKLCYWVTKVGGRLRPRDEAKLKLRQTNSGLACLQCIYNPYSILLACHGSQWKPEFLHSSFDSEDDSRTSITFYTPASRDVYSVGIVQQCISLDSKVGTQSATILNSTDVSMAMLKWVKEILLKQCTNTPTLLKMVCCGTP